MRCKNCHYSLAGLTEHRCPECGLDFDPNDAGTFLADDADELRPSLLRLVLWVLLFVAFIAGAAATALCVPEHLQPYAMLALVGILAIFAIALLRERL